MDDQIKKQIENEIKNNNILIYMKGTPEAPMCGFSAQVTNILKSYKIPFKAINVLEDPEIRQGIKEYSDWPTIPQIYVKGEFIGGCDIIAEMHNNGELKKLLANV